jgi:hypothetical protein
LLTIHFSLLIFHFPLSIFHFPFLSCPIAAPAIKRYATNMKITLRVVVWLAACAILVASVPAVSACPNCKEAVAAGDTDDLSGNSEGPVGAVGAAYSYSVIFMLCMPILLLTAYGAAFYRMAHATSKTGPAVAASHYEYSTSPS